MEAKHLVEAVVVPGIEQGRQSSLGKLGEGGVGGRENRPTDVGALGKLGTGFRFIEKLEELAEVRSFANDAADRFCFSRISGIRRAASEEGTCKEQGPFDGVRRGRFHHSSLRRNSRTGFKKRKKC